MTDEKQDRDPLGLGWSLIGNWIRYDRDSQYRHLMDGSHRDLADMFVRLYRRALGMKAERDQWGKRAGALEDELEIVRAARTAKNVKILTLRGLLKRARPYVWAPYNSKDPVPRGVARFLCDDIDAALGEGASTAADAEAGAPETPGAPSPAPEEERQADGERLLKLAPEMPPRTGIEAMLRGQENRRQEYLRSFVSRLANLEEVTAALERRLDDLSLIRDQQQGSDN